MGTYLWDTLYVCNKRINTQLHSVSNIEPTLTERAKYFYPRLWQREMWQHIYYASSKIFTTSPFESKIFASPTLDIHPVPLVLLGKFPDLFLGCLITVNKQQRTQE